RQDPDLAPLGRDRRVDHRVRQGRDSAGPAARQGRGPVRRGLDRREPRRRARGGAAGERPGGARGDGPVRHGRALPLQGLQRRVAPGEPDPRSRAHRRRAPARREELGRPAAHLCGAHGYGAPGAEPDEHVQRVAAARTGRRRWCRRGGGAGADGAGAGSARNARHARRRRDGPAVPGGGRGPSRGAAHGAAVARDARRAGTARREDRGDRDALRRAPPARRDPLMRVTVLTGGATAERTVAFAGAAQIVEALRGRGPKVHVGDTVTGVPVPAWFMAPVAPEDVTTALGWPVIVKPSKMGSSVGMTFVKSAKGLDAAVELARRYDNEVMAEQFIPGRELTVGILGDVPLPVGEIIPKHELFDYECKYTPGMSEEIFPAALDTTLARQLHELARGIRHLMGPQRTFGMTPWVRRLMVANLVVFLLQDTIFVSPRFIATFGFAPLSAFAQPWTFLTYMFVHANLLHLAFNLLAL